MKWIVPYRGRGKAKTTGGNELGVLRGRLRRPMEQDSSDRDWGWVARREKAISCVGLLLTTGEDFGIYSKETGNHRVDLSPGRSGVW